MDGQRLQAALGWLRTVQVNNELLRTYTDVTVVLKEAEKAKLLTEFSDYVLLAINNYEPLSAELSDLSDLHSHEVNEHAKTKESLLKAIKKITEIQNK